MLVRLNEEKKQDPGTKLKTHCGESVGGHDWLLGCAVGLVGRVTSGWLETRKFTFLIPLSRSFLV
jgi:hypothetical protein